MQNVSQTILRHKVWLIVLILAIAGSIGGYYVYNSNTQPTVSSKNISLERGNILSVVSATGTINPVNSVDISSKITGLIKEVLVLENQTVPAGQILVKLDDTKLQATVEQARARRDNYAANFKRMQQLSNMGAIAPQQLDDARMNYNVYQAAYEDAVSQLSDTIIKAPIAGIVIGKPIPAGQTVSPGISNPMVLLTIADMSIMQIETKVDETDIGKVKVGQKANFSVDSYSNKVFTGKVTSISQKAVIEQNVVYYTVYIDVDSPEGLLKPTMTARVSITVGESKNALIVPLSALKEIKGKKYLTIKDGEKDKDVPVTIGLMSEDKVEIVQGLKDTDVIVLRYSKGKAGGNAKQAQDSARTMRSVMR